MASPHGPAQSGAPDEALRFAGFVLDLDAGTLFDPAGAPVQMRPQAWAVLRELALRPGCTIAKDHLLNAVWPGLVVSDGSLAQAVCDVREALGDAEFQIVKTVPRRGYVLVLPPPEAAGSTQIGTPTRRSIAVLPFDVVDDDKEAQALADGLARDLIHELARNADLRVISHHSSFALAGMGLPLPDISRRLGCRHLVDGELAQRAGQWTLAAQLIDGATGQILWSTRQQLEQDSLADMSAEVVARLAGGLSLSALYEERARFVRGAQRSLDAYSLTMRSLRCYDDRGSFSPRGAAPARELLQQALALDGDYAPAWAWLALLDANMIGLRVTEPRDPKALDECIASARRAIALDRDNTVAYRALAFAELLAGRFESAVSAAERGVEVAPSNADSLQALSLVQLRAGHVDDAMHSIELAADMHPVRIAWLTNTLADVQWAVFRPRQALQTLGAVPKRGRLTSLCALAELGQIEQARAEAQALCTRLPGLTLEHLLVDWSPAASELRERIRAAWVAAGPGLQAPR